MVSRFKQKISISPDALFQEVGGESVIMDLNSEQYFGLNDVGTQLWNMLASNNELEFIFEQLLIEYDVEADQLELDINGLLEELSEAGLIEIIND